MKYLIARASRTALRPVPSISGHVRHVPALAVALTVLAGLPGAALAAPKVQVEPAELDLGLINEGLKFERYLQVTNVGDGVLVLEDVKTSCGCTAAAVDGTVELAAGESQKIRVTFNSKNMEGRVTKKVTVVTNDPEKHNLQVPLRANVYQPVKWSPKYVDLQKASTYEGFEKTLNLLADPELNLEVLDAFILGGRLNNKPSEIFDIEVSEKRFEGKRDVYDFTVRLREGVEPQRVVENIVVLTNLAGRDTLKVPIRGELVGRIRFNPSYAVLRLVEPGQETSRDVVLEASVGTFEVVSAEVPNSPVQVDILPQEGGAKTVIRLTYVGEEAGANGVRQLRIQTDDPDQGLIEIPVRYQTRAAPPSGKPAATGRAG